LRTPDRGTMPSLLAFRSPDRVKTLPRCRRLTDAMFRPPSEYRMFTDTYVRLSEPSSAQRYCRYRIKARNTTEVIFHA
jgi:hypothetical protein